MTRAGSSGGHQKGLNSWLASTSTVLPDGTATQLILLGEPAACDVMYQRSTPRALYVYRHLVISTSLSMHGLAASPLISVAMNNLCT